MANTRTGRSLKVDTPHATTPVVSGTVKIVKIQWSPAAIDNDLEIQDGYGGTIWIVRAAAAATNNLSTGVLYWDNPAPDIPFEGILVPTLDGGNVYIITD